MNYAEIKPVDIANGPGVRVSLFVSGCRHHCKGCFNEIAWDFNYGKEFTEDTINELLDLLKKPYIKGFTFLGGEPLDPRNVMCVGYMISHIRRCEETKDKSIWVYTGYTLEYLGGIANYDEAGCLPYILRHIDVLVDGPFVEDKKNLMLRFRGSENQRIIDMKKTIENHEVTLWDDKK